MRNEKCNGSLEVLGRNNLTHGPLPYLVPLFNHHDLFLKTQTLTVPRHPHSVSSKALKFSSEPYRQRKSSNFPKTRRRCFVCLVTEQNHFFLTLRAIVSSFRYLLEPSCRAGIGRYTYHTKGGRRVYDCIHLGRSVPIVYLAPSSLDTHIHHPHKPINIKLHNPLHPRPIHPTNENTNSLQPPLCNIEIHTSLPPTSPRYIS